MSIFVHGEHCLWQISLVDCFLIGFTVHFCWLFIFLLQGKVPILDINVCVCVCACIKKISLFAKKKKTIPKYSFFSSTTTLLVSPGNSYFTSKSSLTWLNDRGMGLCFLGKSKFSLLLFINKNRLSCFCSFPLLLKEFMMDL